VRASLLKDANEDLGTMLRKGGKAAIVAFVDQMVHMILAISGELR
jgi:hypothetical protein